MNNNLKIFLAGLIGFALGIPVGPFINPPIGFPIDPGGSLTFAECGNVANTDICVWTTNTTTGTITVISNDQIGDSIRTIGVVPSYADEYDPLTSMKGRLQ